MQKKWLIKNQPQSIDIENLRSELKVDRVVASLLYQRNITSFNSAQSFFRPQLTDLHDPFLMLNLRDAAERLNQAINENHKILIYGDYDVDGTTSVAMVYSCSAYVSCASAASADDSSSSYSSSASSYSSSSSSSSV